MWKRKIKSALLLDLDNLGGKRLSESIDNWVAWIEDGVFSKTERPRKLLDKRVYWNGITDKPRAPFEAKGFKAFACRSESTVKVRANKSSADIVMTIDAMEIAHTVKGVQEVILLTSDTDFVPLVNKLQEMKLKVVVVGKVSDPSAAIFRKWAEEVISDEDLQAAYDYRPALKKRAKREMAPTPQSPPTLTAAPAVAAPAAASVSAPPPTKSAPSKRKRAKQQQQFDLAPAAKAVLDVAMQTPNRALSRPVIERALSGVRGFTKAPTKQHAAYLGLTNFEALLKQLATIEPRLNYSRDQSGRWQIRFVGDLPDQPEPNGGPAPDA